MKTILIKDFVKMALTENDGIKIRTEIEKIINEKEEITLDFTDISLFATMFFNASIGYFVLKLSPEICEKRLRVDNISDLGIETYKHSFDNAKTIFVNNNREIIEAAIESDIE